MTQSKMYKRHRFSSEIIQYAGWLCHRFNPSHRGVENLMAERGMRKFKSMKQAQRFLGAHAAQHNLLNLNRHLVSVENYWHFRLRAFASWESAVAI
jgi:putative transposase